MNAGEVISKCPDYCPRIYCEIYTLGLFRVACMNTGEAIFEGVLEGNLNMLHLPKQLHGYTILHCMQIVLPQPIAFLQQTRDITPSGENE